MPWRELGLSEGATADLEEADAGKTYLSLWCSRTWMANSISHSNSSYSSHGDSSFFMSSARPSWKQVNNAAEFQTQTKRLE